MRFVTSKISICLVTGLLGCHSAYAFPRQVRTSVIRRSASFTHETYNHHPWLYRQQQPQQQPAQTQQQQQQRHQQSHLGFCRNTAAPVEHFYSREQIKCFSTSSITTSEGKSNHSHNNNNNNNNKSLGRHDVVNFKRARTWKRLRHLVDLAVQHNPNNSESNDTTSSSSSSSSNSTNNKKRAIADVGTDHGLLALALALSGEFESVVGVDVSEQALKDGAYSLMETIKSLPEYMNEPNHHPSLSLDFRHSDGLKNLSPGEADVVCIAGMGPNTMMQILLDIPATKKSYTKNPDDDAILDIDRLNCQQLILQPINPRPRPLVMLYDAIQESGWELLDERIEELSSRWYITSCFVRKQEKKSNHDKKFLLPGDKLASVILSDGEQKRIFEEYVQHHVQWIHSDAQAANGVICDADRRWLEKFGE